MRTILFSEDIYRGEIRTSDLICPAFGNNYLDIAFVQESQAIPDNVTVVSNLGGVRITKPLYFSQLAEDQLDGAFFNLEWFKYYAPKSGTRILSLFIYADNTRIASVEYQLTAGRGELTPRKGADRLDWGFDWMPFAEEIVMFCPTQETAHWNVVELFTLKNSAEFLEGEGDLSFKTKINNFPLNLGFYSKKPIIGNNTIVVEVPDKSIKKQIAQFNVNYNDCCDIEIRITNRYGLRGAIGGKLIDASEGGDNVKSNFNKVTPYAGIYEWSRKGATIKKEVGFNFEGDEGLLGLLRDGCVYGNVEWYDERTNQWLPCRLEEKSIGNNAWDEQIVTIVLQEL